MRRRIFSTVSVSPRQPFTWAQLRRESEEIRAANISLRAIGCGRGPTMGISPRSTFTSCGSSFEPANNQGARVVAQRSRCDPVLMRNVRCGKIDRDLVPEVQQSLAEMGTYESCASGDENAAVAKHLLVSPLQEGITLRRACPAGSITANEVRANVKLRCMIKYDKVGPLPMLGRCA